MPFRSRSSWRITALLTLLLAHAPIHGQTEDSSSVDWQPGPATVPLGNRAELDLREDHLFADVESSRRLLEMTGNQPSGQELGIVTSIDPDSSWFVVFEYDPVGFVEDDDKDEIDAEALYENIDRGTEQANEWRRERGFPELHLTGWAEKPHYDEKTHNLVWALEARDSLGEKSVNYNTRLLGRRGVTRVTLVTDPSTFTRDLREVEKAMEGFRYVQGERYADFVAGDKLAGYGLTALVAGGAGAAAAKLGLFAKLGKFLAKGWKLVLLGFAALGAGIKRLIGGRREERQQSAAEPPTHT